MRILLLTIENHPLKRVHLTALFLEELKSLGNEIDPILTSFEDGSGQIKVPFNGGILSFLILPFYRWKKYFKARKLVNNNKPDIIIANDGIIEGLIARRLSRKYSIPYAYYLTSLFVDLEKNEFRGKKHPKDLVKWFFKATVEPVRSGVIRDCDIFHPISHAMGKEYNRCKGEIFPLPMCSSKFFLDSDHGSLNSLTKGIHLVYAGAVTPNRKIHLLLEIVHGLIKRYDGSVHLSIFGKVDKKSYQEFLKGKIKDLGLEDNVEILPEVPMEDVPSLIRKANIGLCILPPIHAYRVSSPTKVAEYLSLGIPVVANSEIEDQRMIIKSSGGGLSPPYNVDMIIESILKLARDPKKAKEMGEGGRKWILSNRSYRRLASDLNERYRTITGGGK
jgi:glycosyltransferase involved in cell wall biosynthesis